MEILLGGSRFERRGWYRVLTLATVATVIGAGGLAGCASDDSPTGPGPGGPVGPAGPVGDETGIAGSGTIVAEARDVGGFDQIVFRSEGTVIVTKADDGSLVVETDDNLQQYLQATVTEGALEVATTDGVEIAPTQAPIFRIGMDNATAIDLAGVGTIRVASIATDRLEIVLGGVGDIAIGSVVVDELVLDLHGVGTVTLAGTADQQEARVAGASVYDAPDLASRTTIIDATGTGHAVVWASNDLTVTAADTSSVEYYGTPAVNEELSGAAKVVSLGAK